MRCQFLDFVKILCRQPSLSVYGNATEKELEHKVLDFVNELLAEVFDGDRLDEHAEMQRLLVFAIFGIMLRGVDLLVVGELETGFLL